MNIKPYRHEVKYYECDRMGITRTGEKTFLTEKMMDRKCGSINDRVDKLEALKKAEEEIMREAEVLTK